jgi:hypothetical protein
MRAVVPLFAICAAACLVAHVAIIRSVLRSRSVRASMDVPRPRLGVEILWALLPAVALAFLLGATWMRVRQHAAARTHSIPSAQANVVA